MGAILSFLGTILAKVLGDNVLRWVAFKAMALFLFVVILPLVLNNFLGDILTILFDLVGDNTMDLSSINPTFNMTGLAAWFSEKMQFTQCISVIASALLCKFTLRLIPFVRV